MGHTIKRTKISDGDILEGLGSVWISSNSVNDTVSIASGLDVAVLSLSDFEDIVEQLTRCGAIDLCILLSRCK